MKPTLIVIPGWGANASLWKHQTTHLAEIVEPEVILLTPERSRAEMVEKILKIAPERFLLAGVSMGGWVAQAVAAKAPERVQKLMLLNTWAVADPQRNAIQEQMLAALQQGHEAEIVRSSIAYMLHPERLNDLELVKRLEETLLSATAPVLITQMQAMLADSSSVELHSKIVAPTLIIHGRQDLLFPIQEQLLMQKQIANAKLAIIEDCGHICTVEQPQAVTALMRYFIESS